MPYECQIVLAILKLLIIDKRSKSHEGSWHPKTSEIAPSLIYDTNKAGMQHAVCTNLTICENTKNQRKSTGANNNG